MSAPELAEIQRQTRSILERTPLGRNEFEGRRTKRAYSLLAKMPAAARLVEHEVVLKIIDELLPPTYLLSSAQALELYPGESPQSWHRDDSVDALPMPRQHFGVSTMWALSDYSAFNGATELIPGSHRWDATHEISDEPTYIAEMPAGSALPKLSLFRMLTTPRFLPMRCNAF